MDDAQKSFNQYILYGKEITLSQIISTARKFPMMGDSQLVIIKEAQEIKDWKVEMSIKAFMHYLDQPVPSTILAFAYKHKPLDKRTKLVKELTKKAVMMESKKIYDNQIGAWLQEYIRARKVKMSHREVILLIENIGNNLQRLSNEIEKLLLNVQEGQEIDEHHVHNFVGINRDFNVFELQKSISTGNFLKALKIVNYLASNPSKNPFVLIVSQLFGYFNKLLLIHQSGFREKNQLASLLGVNPFFVGEYIEACKIYNLNFVLRNIELIYDTDLKYKGIRGFLSSKEKEEGILKELIFKLMH